MTKDSFLVLQRQWTWISNKGIRYSVRAHNFSKVQRFVSRPLFDLGILVEEVMRQNAKQPNGRLGPNCFAGIRY
jgi:hypothetical protein